METAVCQKAAAQVPTEPGYGRDGIRHIGGLILSEAITRNVGTFGVDANGKAPSGLNHKGNHRQPTLLVLWARRRKEDFILGAV
jgi:hypothetical protein